jgi:hypothetical protein
MGHRAELADTADDVVGSRIDSRIAGEIRPLPHSPSSPFRARSADCSATIKVEERVNQDERKSGDGSRCAVYRIGG